MKRLMLVCVMISMFILSFAFAEAPADHLGFTLLEQMYTRTTKRLQLIP